MELRNKTVLVTGANRGIGAALVSELLKQNVAKVYAGARETKSLPDFADPRVIPLALDITQETQIQAAAQRTQDVDLLINNAGTATFASVLASPEILSKDMQTNYYGTLSVIRAFVPVLEKNGDGAIVNLLTIVSLASMAVLGGYSASKAALYSATQALRKELKNRGISVHGVFPGPVDTAMTKDFPIAKTSPADVARAILEGLKRGAEDIYPDPMALQMSELWSKNPKELEKQFAAM
jgi:short-subunit dehydrogenase